MAKVPVQTRIDHELKEQVDVLFADLGFSTSDAIRMFLIQARNTGGMPFPLTKQPNAETLAAIAALDNRESGTYAETPEELFEDLGI